MLKALHDLQRVLRAPADEIESITIESSPNTDNSEPVSREFHSSLAAAVHAATVRRNEAAANPRMQRS